MLTQNKRYCRQRCANFARAITIPDEVWTRMARKSAEVRSTKARERLSPERRADYDRGYQAGWSAHKRGARKPALKAAS